MTGIVKTARRSLMLMNIGRREFLSLLVLGLIVAAFEGVGVGLLIPVLGYVEQGPTGVAPRLWSFVASLPVPPLVGLLVLAFVPVLARQAVRYAHQVHAETIRLRAVGRLRTTGFAAMLEGDLPFFVAERQGRLVNTLTSQIEWGASALPFVLQTVEGAILLVVYAAVLLFVAPWLIPLAVVGMVAVLLLVRARVRTSTGYGARVTAAFEALHVIVAERLAGIRLVKLRAQERQEAEAHARVVDNLTATLITLGRQKEAIEVIVEPAMVFGMLVAVYGAVTWLGMTLAELGVVMFVLLRIVPSLKQVISSGQSLGALTASLEEVRSVIDTARRARTMPSGPIVFRGLQKTIRFERVGFRYPDATDRWALRDISFALERGSVTAIVGQSGSGKSTVMDLLARLRDPTEGEITFDDASVARYDLASLRAAIAIVDQHGFLFNDTVANNIAYGTVGATQADIRRAAERAHAGGFIGELPLGYDTVVGDRAVRLSGGQRQRLSLARALLQDPEVLLLDEPTSALDAESERVVQEAITECARTKVVVVVAHRLSTVRRASQILVLREGCIVERGDHTSLAKDDGPYRRLFDLQVHA